MQTINFATRVTVAVLTRGSSSNNTTERAKVQALINSMPLKIDRNVFKKTDEEKEMLKIAKANWKATQKYA